MEIGQQIQKYRAVLGYSQDELAEKIYVTRQTVSNWENLHTYPDLRSLLLLSETFGISLDQLVKGDLEEMKQEIDREDVKKMNKYSAVLAVYLLLLLILPIPLGHWLGWGGLAVYLLIFALGMVYALRVEKLKKSCDVQTYREIAAFMDGKRLDEIEKQREIGKRPYQKVLVFFAAALLSAAVTAFMLWLLT